MQRLNFYFYFLLFGAFLFHNGNLNAQIVTKSYNFPKFEILKFEENGEQIKLLTFDDAITTANYPALPALWDKIEVNYCYGSYQYTLSSAKYQPLTPEEKEFVPEDYTFAEPKVNIKTATDKKHYAMLSIIPIVKSANGQYQRLVSCDIRFEGNTPIPAATKASAKNSVLASGTWYKIAVSSTGLHKVTYADLQKLGVPVSALRSSSIALFGNGGGMIPDINPVTQIDDLLECPIMIVDNGNDLFNENSYFVFYAQGPHSWDYSASNDKFTHTYNIYSDSAYYFINVDAGIGEKKRIETKDFTNQQENKTINTFTHYDFYEKDVTNFGESGREWFDNVLSASSSRTYNFTLPELSNNNARLKISAVSTTSSSSNMEISWGGNTKTFIMAANGHLAQRSTFEQNVPFSSGNVALTLKYISAQTSAASYLDYIEIQAKCNLKINSGAMPFAITENIGNGNIALVQVGNASDQTKIWDVTEHNAVYALAGKLSGTQFSFKTPTANPRHFIAFNGTDYKSVTPVGKVGNQNLHGFANVDMVIVSHPNFLSEANRLAKFRAEQNSITVKVVTPQQVYNEFSSGAQDICAIRNFMRYLYESHAQTIKYLLLFGRPSYDYKGLVKNTQLFVPNYQGIHTSSTITESSTRSCDDFFGIVNANEGDLNQDLIDVAVGRFPVSKLADAKIAVDKTINASVRHLVKTQNASQVANFGDWRNVITFVADDENDGQHFKDAEGAAKTTESKFPVFNLDKIYIDAYPQVSFAGGQRYPEANKAINMRMEKGTLVISYFGHGGGNGWAHERILAISDIDRWKNKFNQPLMITITCSFGWYDKQAISPAERAFLNSNGGVSAIITTSRVTGPGNKFGQRLFHEIGSKLGDRYKTVGEIHKLGKNNSGGTPYGSNMIYLMGDPAMSINIPNQKVKTDTLFCETVQKSDNLIAFTNIKPNHERPAIAQKTQIISAFSKVTVKGRITDDAGNTLTNFNGNIYPSIFDKPVKQKTLGQDLASPVMDFFVQKNIIFKGNATVTNGQFEFSFIVPKDINYEYGLGKISYYAKGEKDAKGYGTVLIGGMHDTTINDDKGPDISLYFNDMKFVNGGLTSPNPTLYAKISDASGINTTGAGIGHDILAIIDGDISKSIILNDYFEYDTNSFTSGSLSYLLSTLSEGHHTLTLRAWDIINNMGESTIDFEVVKEEELKLKHVLNYPNPFTTSTDFYFEHNRPNTLLSIRIQVLTISGKVVWTNPVETRTQINAGYRSDPIHWNGRDDFGDKLARGVYIYKLQVLTPDGKSAEKIEKLVIL